MAEIVSKPSHEWTHQSTCERCGSEVRYDHDDVERDGFGGGWSENGTPHYFVTCPVCGRYEYIDERVSVILGQYVRDQGRDSVHNRRR